MQVMITVRVTQGVRVHIDISCVRDGQCLCQHKRIAQSIVMGACVRGKHMSELLRPAAVVTLRMAQPIAIGCSNAHRPQTFYASDARICAPLQVALIVIMAQLGCRVPAAFASVRPVDRLFTRIGTNDSIETNSSSFMVEMQDTAYIVAHATSRCSLTDRCLPSWCCDCVHAVPPTREKL